MQCDIQVLCCAFIVLKRIFWIFNLPKHVLCDNIITADQIYLTHTSQCGCSFTHHFVLIQYILTSSDGQIMTWFKSRLNYWWWFDFSTKDLIWKRDLIWIWLVIWWFEQITTFSNLGQEIVITSSDFDLIWFYMTWFVIWHNDLNFLSNDLWFGTVIWFVICPSLLTSPTS